MEKVDGDTQVSSFTVILYAIQVDLFQALFLFFSEDISPLIHEASSIQLK